MATQQLSIGCDLTERGFCEAVGVLGVMPDQTTIYCVRDAAPYAYKLREEYGAKVVLLPREILESADCWALGYDNDFVWSPGA